METETLALTQAVDFSMWALFARATLTVTDKFSTHPSGDPVTIDATLSFRELELMERKRYNELRLSATNAPSTADTKGI